MIYADTSALVKLVIREEHSDSMHDAAMEGIVTSELTITELRRAVRHNAPHRMTRAEALLSQVSTIAIGRDILRSASAVEPTSLRSLDAIHLASALAVRDDIRTFIAYDKRLLDAAHLAGIPTASPGL